MTGQCYFDPPSWTQPWACPLSDPGSFTGDWILSHRCLDRTAELMLRDLTGPFILVGAGNQDRVLKLCFVSRPVL